jgi:uncharacterized protein involved in outer membrane biogenesis
MKRFVMIALVVVLVVIASGAILVRYFTRSSRVAGEVTTRLEAIYGGPVRVEGVDVGLSSSTVSGFELFEEGSDVAGSSPWLKVGSLSVDVSLWDLIRGNAMPTKVAVKPATILLRFDREGRLLTRFPASSGGQADKFDISSLPVIDIEQGEIVFRKAGQPDVVARNVSARLSREEGGKLTLAGTADSTELGKLVLDGKIDGQSPRAIVTLKTDTKVHVNQAVLDRLPFVPASILEEAQIAEGDLAAELTIQFAWPSRTLHYRLEAAPENTTVSVPALGLAVQGTQGKLIVADNLVQLRGIRGKAFGGDVEIEGDLDFQGEVWKLTLSKIKGTDLNVGDLPEDWGIPAFARTTIPMGKFSGSASLEVTIRPGSFAPTAVDSLIGLAGVVTGPGSWLAPITALTCVPRSEIQARSKGKGKVVGSDGSSAEFDWKLPLRKPAVHGVSQTPAPGAAGALAPPQRLLLAAMVANTFLLQASAGMGDYPEINVKLGRAAGSLHSGVDGLLREIVDVGGRLVGNLPKRIEPAPTKPDAPPNYLDLNLKLKDVDLGPFVKSLGVKLDFPVEGKLSFQVKASIPVDRTGDLQAYKAKGSAQVKQLALAGVKVEAVDADFEYKGGVLDLTNLTGRFFAAEKSKDPAAGTFRGTGKLQVAPLGELSAAVTLDRVPLSAVAGEAAARVPFDGTLSGKLTARAPADKLKDLASVQGNGTLSSDRMSAYGLSLTQVSASVQLAGGVVRLSDLQGKLEGTPITASAELKIDGAFPFQGQLMLKDWDLSALQKLAGQTKESPLPVSGSFTTSVDVQGALRPFKLAASGDASTAGLKVNTFHVSSGKLHWETDGARVNLTNLDVRLYGGAVTGTAILPLQEQIAGTVSLKLAKLEARELVKDLAVPIKVDGQIDGVLKGTFPPVADGKTRTANFDLDVTAPKLRVQNIPTEKLHGKVDYKDGAFDYKLEGKTLGGTFDLEGQIPGAAVKKESKKGRLRIENVSVSRLAEALNLQDALPLTGRLSIELDFTHETPSRQPTGSGRLRIANLRLRGTPLATEVDGELQLSDGLLRLREIGGEIAQGRFRASLAYNFNEPTRSRFSLALDNVEASELLAPWLGDRIKGPLNARIRAALGAEWRGTIDLELARGEVFGLEVTQWRLPAEFTYAASSGLAQIDIYETSATVARGRVVGKATLSWDTSLRVEGNLRFSGVDVQTFLRQTIGPSELGGGQMTGRFEFAGSNVRSVNDLTGNLMATFSQAQALQLPILRQVAPYVGMGPSTTFQRGDLRSRLDRGVFRIQQLALEGGKLQLHVNGTVSLEGRLNLGVVAKTGDVGAPVLGVIATRIPIAGPVPQLVLQEASVVLARRVIYLEVSGTTHNPVIRLRPLPLLTDEVVRFFLNRSNLPVPLSP